MKIQVNFEDVLELNETKKKVLKNDINEDVFDNDMKRRARYIIEHKYEQCFKRLKSEWEPKLIESGITMIPTDPDAFAELVFQQPGYKSRKQKDLEALQI